ncbi:chloroplast septum site-determining protein [Dunaliella salina]|uniref:Chloroplast septum site-determining protein n=1 Tax=Dunaliella salina TaxID=3046 RepID=A0ABQ7FZJ1_DUNSA|nr:chloroplast septum site-determining protein [Dunaliella salina]|eukprot:KAF5827766.1 chloroplast septum site-determining protein [Dunaliella salina]
MQQQVQHLQRGPGFASTSSRLPAVPLTRGSRCCRGPQTSHIGSVVCVKRVAGAACTPAARSQKPHRLSPLQAAEDDLDLGPDFEEGRVIVVTSGKGGVGKTTSTANLGMSIARLGYKVALIDADIGLSNCEEDLQIKELSQLKFGRYLQKYNVTRRHMEELCDNIMSLGYQFILIDCPAGIDVGFINAISPAKEGLIITTPEITSIRDADRVAGLLEANGVYNVKLLVNRVRPEMIQKNDMMSVKDVQEMLGIPLLGAIPEDPQVIVSTNRGEPLVLQKKLTLSGIAFENSSRRLIGKQDYFIDLNNPTKGIFQRLTELFT